MPRGDGTGPSGQGAMSGRGMGSCNNNLPRFNNSAPQRMGYGMGRAGNRPRGFQNGFGNRNWFNSRNNEFQNEGISQETERSMVTAEMSYLKEQMSAMQKRLSELDSKEK